MGSRVLGVDFSGASDAGRSLWLTEARCADDGMVIEDCYRAADEWGASREAAHAGLQSRITDGFDVVGLDFPFSLPQALLDEHCDGEWAGLIEWLTLDGPADPDTFASTCRSTAREHTGDGTATLRRETDLRRAALCPYDRMVQYQTFYGIQNVLAGVADDPAVAVAPMQHEEAPTRVVEVYPAATFGWLGLYREGYKGDKRARRETNVAGIEDCSVDVATFRETCTESHDALDSLAAALSAGRVATTDDPPLHGSRDEGHIYV
jgi:hypothetical protein